MFKWAVGDPEIQRVVRDRSTSRQLTEQAVVKRRITCTATDVGDKLCRILEAEDHDVDISCNINEELGHVEITFDDPTASMPKKQIVKSVRHLIDEARQLGCTIVSSDIADDIGARLVVGVSR